MVSIRDSNVFWQKLGFASPNAEGLAGLETACALEILGEISGRSPEKVAIIDRPYTILMVG